MLEKNKNTHTELSLWELFVTIFRINLMTFGGGYTIIPIIRQAFVYKKEVISDKEMLDIIALSESTPGAMAISCSYLVGLRVRGILGGAVAVLGAVLPPFLVISIVYYFYTFVADNTYVRAALRGMGGVIVAMLLLTTKDLFKSVIQPHPVYALLLMIGAGILSYFHMISTALVIACLAFIGIVSYLFIFHGDPNAAVDPATQKKEGVQ